MISTKRLLYSWDDKIQYIQIFVMSSTSLADVIIISRKFFKNPLVRQNQQDFIMDRQSIIQHKQVRTWLYRPKSSKFGTKRNKRFNDHHWSLQQNQKYAKFLHQFQHIVDASAQQKRKNNFNRMMSKYIGTRSPTQCRSHHQQMMKQLKSWENIVKQMTICFQDRKQEISQTTQMRLDQTQMIDYVNYQKILNNQILWASEEPGEFIEQNCLNFEIYSYNIEEEQISQFYM